MPPVLRRLVAALLISFCLLLPFATSGHASALPSGGQPEAGSLDIIPNDDDTFLRRWDPVPGTKAFAGFHERGLVEIGRRDCLPNGTNFCFGDSVNFCSSCGTCCTDGLYCCGSGGICCGGGCCASGQTCDQGKCVSSNGPVTVTSITFQTITHVATQVATVLVVVVETSTVVSTTETTVSNAETQTNVIWITETTTLEKRALQTAEVRLIRRAEDPSGDAVLEPTLSWRQTLKAAWASVTGRGLPHAIHPIHHGLERRQATRDPLTVQGQSTITRFATSTVDFTDVVSTTITTESTSLVLTTIIRTNTIVVNAKATIDVTSTWTISKRQPVTQVITTTENPITPGVNNQATARNPSSTPTPSQAAGPLPASSSPLKTSSIVGIAIGGVVAAVIVAAIVIFFLRYRRKRNALDDNPNANLPADVNELDREPMYPALTHFTPAATTKHHSMQFHPPPGGVNGAAYLDPNQVSPSTSPTPNGHHRNSSGYSTLVGAPYGAATAAAAAGNKRASHRVSAMTSQSGEVYIDQGNEWNDSGRSSGSPPLASGSGTVQTSRHGSLGNQQDMGPIGQAYYLGPQQQQGQYGQSQQQPPGELDGTAIAEMGIGNPYADEIEEGQKGGPRQWNTEPRYDGGEYGDPRSPSVAPPGQQQQR